MSDIVDEETASHYSEIDKTSPRGSNWSTWPEDLQSSSASQTYVNISNSASSSLIVPNLSVPAAPPPPPPLPPPPPSVGPNLDSSKPKSNCELAQSMNELSLNSKSANVTKKLDPTFLAELEKHLGEKEATKNTNASRKTQETTSSTNYLHYPSSDKLRQGSSTQITDDSVKSLSVIPVLKPPPLAKPKSPMTIVDHQASSPSMLPTKVQNSWQPKNTNIQRPPHQFDQNVIESVTDAIVGQIWQQTQTQHNIQSTDLTENCQISTPVAIQESVNLFQEATGDVSINDGQHGPSNITKATFIQTQAGSSINQNYPQNTANINSSGFSLLQDVASNIASSNTNETQRGPCNVTKAIFNQAQTSSSNSHNCLQNMSNVGQVTSNPLQIASSNVPINSMNELHYGSSNISKANFNQAQACSSTNQNYLHNTSNSFNLFQTIPNHMSGNTTVDFQYGLCNKGNSNQTQICPLTSQNYSQNTSGVNQRVSDLQQNYVQNMPTTSNVSNSHGISHIQNDLQQQHNKPITFLSDQVYAELKQTVHNFHNNIFMINALSIVLKTNVKAISQNYVSMCC